MSIAVVPRTYSPTPTPRSFEGLKRERTKGLGGNDVAVLAGQARFDKTPTDVYLSKVAPHEEDEPGPDLKRGIGFEEHAIEIFEAATGLKVTEPKERSVAMEGAPWAQARVDGVLGEKIVEVKLPRTQTYHEWLLEGLPMQYVLQAVWYLGITGAESCVWWIFCVEEYEGTTFEFYPDPQVFKFLFELGEAFWNDHVVPRIPPGPEMPLDLPTLPSRQGELERIPEGDRVEVLTGHLERANYIEAKSKAQKERARDLLADELGAREGVLLSDGTKVYYREGKPKKLGLDEKALRAAEPLDRLKVAVELRDVIGAHLDDERAGTLDEVAGLAAREAVERMAKCGLDLDQYLKFGQASRPVRIYPPKG